MAADTAAQAFRAMGSDCHLIVVGGPGSALDAALRRIDDLEQRWSRFIPTSDISRLNAAGGRPVTVGADTADLVSRALVARRLTRGAFDPTVLGDVIRAGYATSFDERHPPTVAGVNDMRQGTVSVDGARVTLAPSTGFDPGGIGKGLAADVVVTLLRDLGADGACVNVGGDVRVWGAGPTGAGWSVAIDHPWRREPLAVVGLDDGAVATSTTLRRRWSTDGRPSHHLIDPATGCPSTSGIALVSVIAGDAWIAEVVAKAALLAGPTHCFDLVAEAHFDAIAVTDDGDVRTTPGVGRHTDGANVPTHVRREENVPR
jgi:thiamine biosynthesis lipoprotein